MAQMMVNNGQRPCSYRKDLGSFERDWCGLIGCIVKWKKSKLQKKICNVLLFMKKERKMRLAICADRVGKSKNKEPGYLPSRGSKEVDEIKRLGQGGRTPISTEVFVLA